MNITGLRRIRVISSRHGRPLGGFKVRLEWLPGHDELWEVLEHEALFEAQFDAQVLADRIARTSEIDLTYWVWTPSRCSPIGALQDAPNTIHEVIARAPTAAAVRHAARPTID